MMELSIVIATSDGAASVQDRVSGLTSELAGCGAVELVLVEQGSGSSVDKPATPFALTMAHTPGYDRAQALNHGIGLAGGQICLFLDPDVIVEPGLIEEHLAIHHRVGPAVVVGRRVLPPGTEAHWFVQELAREQEARHRALVRGDRTLQATDWSTGNLSAPRAALLAAQGFVSDVEPLIFLELAQRLVSAGLSPIYAQRARCHAVQHAKPAKAIAQIEDNGRGAIRLSRRRSTVRRELLDFNDRPGPGVVARRTLLAAGVPAAALLAVAGIPARFGARAPLAAFVSRYAFWRGVRSTVERDEWLRLTIGTSILMYHAVTPSPQMAGRYVIPVKRLERQLRALAWLRRIPIPLDAFIADHRSGRLPPARSIVVTFDDGYLDNLELAAPALLRRNVPATVFVVTGRLGRGNDWDSEGALAGRSLLAGTDIAALRATGISVGAHTRSHPALPSLEAEARRAEVSGSKADLERALGEPVRAFAFPHGLGADDPACVADVAAAGFEAACTVIPGRNTSATPLLGLRRAEVYGTDSLLRFAQAVLFGDSQAIWRRARRRQPG